MMRTSFKEEDATEASAPEAEAPQLPQNDHELAADQPSQVVESHSAPLGSWALQDLHALPRFPDRESFAMAKDLISCFLRGELLYLNLRIALFWLGFGLLEAPTQSQPTLNLVPLCKDLDTYTDTALELGYDSTASVHGWPVPRLDICALELEHVSLVLGRSSSSSSAPVAVLDATRAGGHPTHRTTASSSSSSATTPHGVSVRASTPMCTMPVQAVQRSGSDRLVAALAALPKASPFMPQPAPPPLFPASNVGVGPSLQSSLSSATRSSGSSCHPICEDPIAATDGIADVPSLSIDAREPHVLETSRGREFLDWRQSSNAASSSGRAQEWAYDGVGEVLDGDDVSSQVLAYKVKLLHAGGWSSGSSSSNPASSEGQMTPPTGGPSSSTAAEPHPTQSAGGLATDHVEQFTVSFMSDLQMHEDLADTSCLCTFCLDDMKIGEELCRLPCMHTFHRRCVFAWLARDRRCMLCRLDITRPRG